MKKLLTTLVAIVIAAVSFAQGNVHLVVSSASGQQPQTLVNGLVDSLAALRTTTTQKQLLNSNLTTISGLSPSNDDVLQRKAGAWANRTIAQLKTDLGIAGTNSGDQDLSGYMVKANNLSDLVSASTARTNLGATTVGGNLFTLTNPSAVRYVRINANNTITLLDNNEFRSDIGAQLETIDLDAIAALSPSNDDILQRKAGSWANRTIAQFKTDLSLSGSNTGDQTSVTGNAGTATALQNARTIGAVSFDGTANIVPQTIQSVNEATDATCFPLFITNSGSQSLQPANNTSFTFNSSTAQLGATLINAGTGFKVNGAAASNTILKGNGTNYVASTETYAAPGTSGNVMTSDGTNWTSAAPVVTASNSVTLTNKTISFASNTIQAMPVTLVVAASDESTAITTGTAKITFRMPYAMTLSSIRGSLTTASSSGLVTINVKEGGTTVFSTQLTLDANEKTSTTAATAAVLSDTAIADDAEITIDIVGAGTGAAGLKITFIGTR